ncbi:MAG: hypothetical protein WC749_04675 [Dehalococcoidia bacterium]
MEMNNDIICDAEQKIRRFNRMGLHYNLVAGHIYQERYRGDTGPFSRSYLQYIIAGLISFDVGRMMGSRRYELKGDFFASRLERKFADIRGLIEPILNVTLADIDLNRHEESIFKSYDCLSANGNGSLNEDSHDHFYVGASKVLHFLNPALFIMLDSNACRAFRKSHNVPFRKGTVPGYTSKRYLECMRYAQKDIQRFGQQKFQALDPGVPLTRIYDKLTFITGLDEGSKDAPP